MDEESAPLVRVLSQCWIVSSTWDLGAQGDRREGGNGVLLTTLACYRHFSNHILGPLKSRLDKGEQGFSCASFLLLSLGSWILPFDSISSILTLSSFDSPLPALVSSSAVVNTITPLLSGFLVPKFGAGFCGLVATGCVLTGQAIVFWRASAGGETLWGMVSLHSQARGRGRRRLES